ncbi:hypothetical protein OS176_11805 [Xanthomonadaceae bacterium XH05]|nr:hypothetical protein [Xanthomonadaceae bacterium XH05]
MSSRDSIADDTLIQAWLAGFALPAICPGLRSSASKTSIFRMRSPSMRGRWLARLRRCPTPALGSRFA